MYGVFVAQSQRQNGDDPDIPISVNPTETDAIQISHAFSTATKS